MSRDKEDMKGEVNMIKYVRNTYNINLTVMLD